MAACGSLQQIFEKPLPENSTLLESLSSWNQIRPVKPTAAQTSFTEIFGELHFKENSQSSSFFTAPPFSSPPSSLTDINPQAGITELKDNDSWDNKYESKRYRSIMGSFSSTLKHQHYTGSYKNGDSFSPMNYESLQLCTEGLGFESSDDVEDLSNHMKEDGQCLEKKSSIARHSTSENPSGECRRSRSSAGAFPPPISCIGKSGKPWVCFKSYRHDGRFVLKEVRIPALEVLHACREDGRLKLQFVHPIDEILDEAEDGEEAEGGNCTEYEEQEEKCDNDDGEKEDSE